MNLEEIKTFILSIIDQILKNDGGRQIINDDLSILSQKSKKKFKSILKKFNHRLKIEDFENE